MEATPFMLKTREKLTIVAASKLLSSWLMSIAMKTSVSGRDVENGIKAQGIIIEKRTPLINECLMWLVTPSTMDASILGIHRFVFESTLAYWMNPKCITKSLSDHVT